jgi:hypothetical protein
MTFRLAVSFRSDGPAVQKYKHASQDAPHLTRLFGSVSSHCHDVQQRAGSNDPPFQIFHLVNRYFHGFQGTWHSAEIWASWARRDASPCQYFSHLRIVRAANSEFASFCGRAGESGRDGRAAIPMASVILFLAWEEWSMNRLVDQEDLKKSDRPRFSELL